ncbi:mCG1034457 [Mus musculus]|nr:mCG1034457 [Mus musculus]
MPRTCVSRIMNRTALLPSPASGGVLEGRRKPLGMEKLCYRNS